MQDMLASGTRLAPMLALLLLCPTGAQGAEAPAAASGHTAEPADESSLEGRLREIEELVQRQRLEIDALRRALAEGGANGTGPAAPAAPPSPPQGATPAQGAGNSALPDAAQRRVDDLYKKFGPLQLSGDLRFRVEPFFNQGFDSLVQPPDRTRMRVRARVALDGALGARFDWGLRGATGAFTDPISPFQTLSDFYERKAVALERAFVRYDSKGARAGVQLVAGKFEPTFRRSQLVWDDDVNVEGASEALYVKTDSKLKQLRLVAFHRPFEAGSAGKDGMLLGGQLQSDWQASPKVSANLNLGYYHFVKPDHLAQLLGAPTTQVNGGVSLNTTNRLRRDAAGQPVGFVAGFHLFDVLGSVSWRAGARFPVAFTVDYVRNVSDRIEDEKNGYWAGVQVGQARDRGDVLIGYTFARIEQDAVLVPFNYSDILGSNSRVHLPTLGYQLASGVTLQWTGAFSQRAKKIVPGSPFNRIVYRMLFDVTYKF